MKMPDEELLGEQRDCGSGSSPGEYPRVGMRHRPLDDAYQLELEVMTAEGL
jgi:hypothetical protein